MSGLKPLITISGTTGVGKSKLAIELALALSQHSDSRKHGYHGARIINADAMQVYAGMDIITNKITAEEMCGVDHLLMGFKQPGEQYIVTEWVRDAMKVIDETHERNQIPIVIGGTSYWIQHLVFSNKLISLDEPMIGEKTSGEEPPLMSEELTKSLTSLPPELLDLFHALPEENPTATAHPELAMSLHTLLSRLDPPLAERFHWRDTRKVLRNLTIIRDRRRRVSEIYTEQSQVPVRPRYRTLCFWLYAKPEILKFRLDARVDKMVQQGLLDEIRALREIAKTQPAPTFGDLVPENADPDIPNMDYTLGIYQAIGYKEFHDYLNAPAHSDVTFEEALESMKSGTRRYAKRQLMWIRNQLLPAARAANSVSRLEGEMDVTPVYLLDATELGPCWRSNVQEVAERITEAFLNKAELPDPLSLSDTAREVLTKATEGNETPTETLRMRVCEVCTKNKDRPMMIEENQWDAHIKTRAHRRFFKKGYKAKTRPQSDKGEESDSDALLIP